MAASRNQESDPGVPALTEEVVRSLFKFCGEQISENITYCNEQISQNNKDERELTNAKIIKVINSLNDNTEVIRKHNTILKDLDLKIETSILT